EVDPARKRIGLTMRLNDDAAPVRRGPADDKRPAGGQGRRNGGAPARPAAQPAGMGAMAAAFAKLRK
ncbi:MAG: hypothetical protein OZ927_11450, partial [Alcaligenaceae bacterium]|nr:hypothetical protein [Alcaligenaceae bacterium]